MATYYCGPGGNDGNNGLSWANRRLTLNGIEDIPVAAGDLCYIAPGTYRETLTLDVSGSVGSPITYVADVTGQNTDSVGGVVRVTGSDNDQAAARGNCITGTGRSYRTFRGFRFDGSSSTLVTLPTSSDNYIFEDCGFDTYGSIGISFGASSTNNTIRRCVFLGNPNTTGLILISNGSTQNDSANLIEVCLFVLGGNAFALRDDRVGGITMKHCYVYGGGGGSAVRVFNALAGGQTVTVNNSIIHGGNTGLNATTTGEITEDYNTFCGNVTNRINTATGANSQTYFAMPELPMLFAGIEFPWKLFQRAPWSPVRAIAGTSMSSLDLFGITRPATDSKKSWGPIQFVDSLRDTGTVRTGTASIKLADAGRHQIFVPVTNVSTTISVYVQWEADYAGTKPQLVVKQPGQSDQTDTATGSSGSWEELTLTFTPAASPPYVIVELVSNNTGSGNIDCFFDDLTVS